MTAVGGFGPPDPDGYVRASSPNPRWSASRRSEAVSGGVSSEFALACDMRFASRENTRPRPTRSRGVGLHPGGRRYGTPPTSGRVAVGRSKSFSARMISTATPQNDTGYVNRCTSRRRTGRPSSTRLGAPDRLLRPACHRRREESRQPCLVAVRRSAPSPPSLLLRPR